MILVRIFVFSLFAFSISGGTSATEDAQKAGEAMLDRARQLADIRSPGAPPFRLGVTFSFIGQDLETVQGTYTEVWISNSQWRRETAIGNLRRIEVAGPTRVWLADGGSDFPEQAARVPAMVEVFPSSAAKFEFESVTELNAATRCFVTKAAGEMHPRHGFCFDKNNHLLVKNVTPQLVGQGFADYACNYWKFIKFGDYFFPREMACSLDRHRKMEAKVVDLSTELSPDAALFTPPAGALEMGNCLVGSVPPQAVTTPEPRYPKGKVSRLSSVALWMIIDIKGQPQDVKVTRSGGKEFDDSAIISVRDWRFKPGTCNGQPMPMPTAVEIAFRDYR